MENISSRLKKYIGFRNISIRAFEKSLKWGNSTVNNLKDKISTDKMLELKDNYPELNLGWLTSGQGTMTVSNYLDDPFAPRYTELKDMNDSFEPMVYPSISEQLVKVTDKKKRQKEGITPIEKDAYMWVEYQDLSAVAGRLGGANLDVLPEHKKKLVPNEFDSGNYLVVRVDGDSMQTDSEISIPNGSEILIKEYVFEQGEKLPIRDNLWVIVSREGTVFKQIIEHNVQQEYITVHSYNPRFKDYDIMMEDIIQLFIYRKIVSSRPRIPDITK